MSMSPSPHDSVAPGSAHPYRIHPLPEPPRPVASPKPANFNPLRFCLPAGPTGEQRHALIANAAYFRAQRRGFRAGHELEDWLAAEAEVEQQLADARRRRPRPEK
jgi:hypothetical protein